MRRNKFGALLIATQMAVTLAFLANAITLVEQRASWSTRPSGLDEANIFILTSESVDHLADAAPREATDIATLRALPGVVDAYTTNMYPMQGGGWIDTVTLKPDQKTPTAITAHYMGDEHGMNTMGLKLVAGRYFTAAEIEQKRPAGDPAFSGLIVSKALAEKLFPNENALGKMIYFDSEQPSPIIGVVDRLMGPTTVATGVFSTFQENAVISPIHLVGETNNYMVRVAPGQLGSVMKAAESKLYALDENRIVHTKSMSQVRSDAYRGDHGLIVLLTSLCAALLIVTAFGIIGLTSYWVAQRRQQIGIRRALGATRQAIVRYFQTENFMIAISGAVVGIAFAIALNLWMVRSFEMVRMDNSRAIVGAAVILLLGQFAVLWPALRAASIPPALATRGG
jgi:putative ABC transport system permease protein